MKPNGHRLRGEVRHRAARFGLWRAVAAAPAMLGSLLLVMLASVAVGRWAGLLPLTWAVPAAVLMTRVGERMAVRAVCGFHRLSPTQEAVLQPAWSTALRVTGTAAGDVELYVRTARAPNAYAAGRRSVAVTNRVIDDYRVGRLREDQWVAVLVHELGHHATAGTGPMMLLAWLSGTWRVARSLLTGLASILAGRQRRRAAPIALLAGLAVAALRTLHQGQWTVAGVLAFLGLAAVLCPLGAAAISRRCEYTADRFAADHGLARPLADALHTLADDVFVSRGPERLWASYPAPERRIDTLRTTAPR